MLNQGYIIYRKWFDLACTLGRRNYMFGFREAWNDDVAQGIRLL